MLSIAACLYTQMEVSGAPTWSSRTTTTWESCPLYLASI